MKGIKSLLHLTCHAKVTTDFIRCPLNTYNIHHINNGYIHSRSCDQDGSDMLSLAGFYSRFLTYLGGMRVLVLVRGLLRADESKWLCCDNGFRFRFRF